MVLVYIISDNTSNTLTFNKSKFIAFLYKVSNIDDVNNILSDLKVLYKDESHICYDYCDNIFLLCVRLISSYVL